MFRLRGQKTTVAAGVDVTRGYTVQLEAAQEHG